MQFARGRPKTQRGVEGLAQASEESPLGEITVVCSGRGLRGVTVRSRRKPARGRNRSAAAGAATRSARLARQALTEIGEYLAGRRRQFAVPLDLAGSPFQLKVWKALLEIPYGQTRSYGEIARAVGRPQAARAVGRANRSNPAAIIVPCHRVIAGDGSLGGYAGGLEMKLRLLDLEQAVLSRQAGSTRQQDSLACPA